MKELDKGLDVSLKGPEAEEAIEQMRRQIAAWGLVMPPPQPLVFDFGLGKFGEIGEIESWIANEVEAGYCGKFLFVFDGQTCPTHYHRQKHETFFIVKGRVRMMYDGAEREMETGEVLAVPPGKVHRFTGIGPALVMEVSKPSIIDDNYFEDTNIPIGGNYKGRSQE